MKILNRSNIPLVLWWSIIAIVVVLALIACNVEAEYTNEDGSVIFGQSTFEATDGIKYLTSDYPGIDLVDYGMYWSTPNPSPLSGRFYDDGRIYLGKDTDHYIGMKPVGIFYVNYQDPTERQQLISLTSMSLSVNNNVATYTQGPVDVVFTNSFSRIKGDVIFPNAPPVPTVSNPALAMVWEIVGHAGINTEDGEKSTWWFEEAKATFPIGDIQNNGSAMLKKKIFRQNGKIYLVEGVGYNWISDVNRTDSHFILDPSVEYNGSDNWAGLSGTMLEHGDGNLRAPPSVWEGIAGFWSPGTDVGSGTTLKDLSGNGNDGTIHGATWNITSDALEYNGTSDYVDLDEVFSTPNFTFISKVMPYTTNPISGSPDYGLRYVFSMGASSILFESTNLFKFRFNNGTDIDLYSSNSYNLNQTYDTAGTIGDGYTKMYIDGNLQDTEQFLGNVVGSNDVRFGNNWYSNTRHWHGLIGATYIYNTTLTNDQINETRDNYHNITSYMETDSPIDAGTGYVNMYVWFNGTDAGSNTTIELQVKQNDTATWETAIADVTMNTNHTIPAGMLYQNASFRWYANTSYQPETDVIESVIFEPGPIPTPTVTLLSQTPSVIYQNSTGYMNISYGITHSNLGLNNTSVSFIYRNYDPLCGCSNHSIRPPTNDLATEWDLDGRILRAANRNESLNFENNATITGGNTYDWSGLDENSTRLTIVPVNSTYTLVYINGTIHDIMPQSWYLDRSDLEEAPKTQMAIHKTQNLLIKSWNIELFKGNYDHVTVGYTDTMLESNPAAWPSDANPLNYYYVNDSYDPATDGDPLASGYAVYMGSGNASEWIDHVYSPHANSSYVRAFINNTVLHQYINTTEISYLYLTSNTPSSKPYYINVTGVASSTNVSFADTGVLWAGDATLSQQNYTPNTWLAFMKDDITFDHKLYVADNNDAWENSTLSSTVVGPGLFPPTTPTFYSFHNGYVDYDMNGTYYGTIQIQIGVATDPDGGNVTHKTTLHYSNKTLITEINNVTYPPNGVYTNVSFDTTSYSTLENYTLRLVATDDENESVTVWLGVNFTINYDNFSFTNATISPSAIREGEPFTASVDITDIDGNIVDAIVKINGGNYSMVNTAGDTWAYTFTGTSIPTRYEIDNFYAQDDFGAWNSTTSSLYIDALPSTGTGSSGGIRPRIIPAIIPEPIVNVTEEVIIEPLANISEIIERLVSEDIIKIFKFNYKLNTQIYNDTFYVENVQRCEFTSDVIAMCDVEAEHVTVTFVYEPDGMIYTHSDSITLYADGYSEYREVDIYVVNFANPVWWIMLIVIVGAVVLYRRNKK